MTTGQLSKALYSYYIAVHLIAQCGLDIKCPTLVSYNFTQLDGITDTNTGCIT